MSLTKYMAIDCEMVGIGHSGKLSMLARVSVVNEDGVCVYDAYVKPYTKVTDYRTQFSGIRQKDLKNGKDFLEVRKKVKGMLKGRIVVGHSVEFDFNALRIFHPAKDVRDTAEYKPFLKMYQDRSPPLRWLAKKFLKKEIQTGEHCSIEDAAAVMKIYKCVAQEWEESLDN